MLDERVSILTESAPNTPNTPSTRSSIRSDTSQIYNEHRISIIQLLFMHRSTNPITSPYLTSLAALIYIAVINDGQEYPNVDADAFWILGEMSREYDDLADKDAIQIWMRDFGLRLAALDSELSANLVRL
jgi:hypothetical protein